jgi:hypothetical protein
LTVSSTKYSYRLALSTKRIIDHNYLSLVTSPFSEFFPWLAGNTSCDLDFSKICLSRDYGGRLIPHLIFLSAAFFATIITITITTQSFLIHHHHHHPHLTLNFKPTQQDKQALIKGDWDGAFGRFSFSGFDSHKGF